MQIYNDVAVTVISLHYCALSLDCLYFPFPSNELHSNENIIHTGSDAIQCFSHSLKATVIS